MQQLDLFTVFRPAPIPVDVQLPDRHPLNGRVSGIVTGLTREGLEIDVFYDFGERRWRYYGFPGMPPEVIGWRPTTGERIR